MPSICDSPPDFTLPIYGGGGTMFTMSEAEQGGKVLLLSFSSWGCGSCWAFYPFLNAIASDYLPNDELEIIQIHYGPLADEAGFDALREGYGYPPPAFTVLFDTEQVVGPVFWEGMLPPFEYLISRNYKIVNRWGRNTGDEEPLSFDTHSFGEVDAFIRNRIDDLLVERDRWNTVLTLDFSGSMNTDASVAGITKPKVDFLRDAVDSWLRVWRDYACCSDQLGLVYFGSHANIASDLQAITPVENVEAILTDVATKNAGGKTAMGAAIASAIDLLETEPISDADPHERYVVVFTDGMQNRNPAFIVVGDCGDDGDCIWMPQIRMASEDEFDFYGWDYLGDSDYDGPLPRILFGNVMQTAIHTIGIGAPDAYQGLLGVISNETGGATYSDSEVWPFLKEFFLESLVESFRGSSLQVVRKWHGTLAADETQTEMTFRLNRPVRKATILVSWLDEAVPLQVGVVKDGMTLSLNRKQSVQATSSITTLPFPLYQPRRMNFMAISEAQLRTVHGARVKAPMAFNKQEAGRLLDAEGEYTVVINRMFPESPSDVPFHVMVVADDHDVEVDLAMPRSLFFTGQAIPLEIVATDHGQPVRTLFCADVDVHRPVVPFSKLLLDTYRKLAKDVRYEAVLDEMWRDPEIAQQIQARKVDAVRLTRASANRHGDPAQLPGRIRDRYTNTRVPGHYRIQALVRGVTATGGVFERVVTKSVQVIARPEATCSDLRGNLDKSGSMLSIHFRPTDRAGNLLGPGYASMMLLALDNVTGGMVRDKRDGTYEITAELPKQKTPAEDVYATLWVAGERMFRGPLSRLVGAAKGR
ncbi:MAG: VWA domain-containing protein [Deltaproteobacteria bacterium]|nr:VWA domain-containing protein [Deltaproteobacteria bacterium]